MTKHATHNTGNIGLYFACYQLAKLGWNVMPTARNVRGADGTSTRTDCALG